MADLERGQRIKAQREDLHLTQPAVVDLLETAAKGLPADHPLHPGKAGKPPVTLRGYQTWENGGGIAWEKAKLLAGVLRTDVAALINGAPVQAPDPFAAADGSIEERLAELATQLAADREDRAASVAELKVLLDTQNRNLQRQSLILEGIEKLLATQESAARHLDEAAQQIVREQGGTALEADPPPPAAKRTKTAKSRTPPASRQDPA